MTGPLGNQPRFEWNAGSVRAMRRFLGMSQSMFAAELGVRQQTVSEWETGMYRPRGASATLLTMIATNSGFIHDVPGYSSGFAPTAVHAQFEQRPAFANGVGMAPATDPVRSSGPPHVQSASRPEVAI